MLRYEIKTSTDGMTNSRAFTAEITSAVMPWTVDKTNKYYFYTFSLCPNTTLTESDVFDLSVYNSSAFSNFFFSNNKLSSAGGVLGGASSSTESFSPSCFIIANTQNAYTTIDLTSFSVRLFDNEAKGQFSGNTFNCGEISSTSSASIVFNNYFGSFVKLCTFGRSFCSNIIEGALVSSSFSNSCTLNYIGKGCSVLTFYYGCNKNIIESSCTGITLESANTNTKIGSACSSITIGTSCDANIFNPNCKSITLSSCKALFFGPRVNWGGSSTRSYTNKEGAQVWT